MNIAATGMATSTASPTEQAQRKTTLDQVDFMNLMVAQLQNQNPLEPMDSAQMASQMAQLGSLQALNTMSASIQKMVGYQSSINSLNAAQLIGKKVEITGGNITIDKGTLSEASYQLSKPGKVTIRVYDANNQLVRVIEEGVKDTAKQKVAWDGKDQNGVKLSDGTYTFRVSAVDGSGQSILTSTSMVGTVTGISFENWITYLMIGSGKITLSDITSILS